MYDIWLALNILFELFLGYLPLVAAIVVAWLVLMAIAFGRGRPGWRRGLGPALMLALLVAIAAFLAIPSLTKSSLSEMGYWVDWANLIAIALGFGGVALALAWPLFATLRRRFR
ncbi:MAG: hypothetical protein GX576_02675 [Thauera phenolivorans]|uniref:Uncharacterized protein n=1 Tax=Thauera phenolivorans TaxID=1792543 RepID=A0A7X7LU00_9RHOO|nr:hypothetical protein [Thauera phenolivorans]NLF53310.1 hypothetical protein [Thauera phenolivorans]